MAQRQAKQSVAEVRQQPSVLSGHNEPSSLITSPQRLIGRQPQGMRKELSQIFPRRSDSLDANAQQKPSLTSNLGKEQAHPQTNNRKRKRSKESEDPVVPDTIIWETEGANTKNDINPTKYWTLEGRWPKEYFQQDSSMAQRLPRKRSVSSFSGKQLEAGSSTPRATTPSDQKPREIKAAPYLSPQYQILLETKGSFMRKSELGITDASKTYCQTLLESEQIFPEDSLFQDDLFDETCDMIQARNEAKVIQDIAQLIVPSAQSLAIRSDKSLKILIESVNEGWNNSFPVTQPRPQPDYAVGFKRTAFTEDQHKKLQSLFDFMEKSYYMATYYMYLPFLTCEVKCGAAALDIADRQNAHSMTIAVRGVVELFRLVGREKELHREILAFSISHNDKMVRIHGHYPVINEKNTTYYRHPIRTFDFTELDGKEKWTAYKFTKNVYDTWMPTHFKRICSVIDELPHDINFEVSELPSLEGSGLSQPLEDQSLLQSNVDTVSPEGNVNSQSSIADSITPNTPLSHGTEQGVFKKPKKTFAAE